jgi:hypothetical protein
MNNEFSPVVVWLELSQCCKNMITTVLGIQDTPLRKCHNQGKSQWIRCNGFAKRRWEVELKEIVGDRGVAEHSNKFVVDDLDRESLHREKQAD